MKKFVEFKTGKEFDSPIALSVECIVHVGESKTGHAIIKVNDGSQFVVDQNFEGAMIKIESAIGDGD